MFPRLSQFLTNNWNSKTVCSVSEWLVESIHLSSVLHSTADIPAQIGFERSPGGLSCLNSWETLEVPGCTVEWLHFEEGEEVLNTVSNPWLGWKTRLKLLISGWKGQGSRQGGWKQTILSSELGTAVKAPATPRRAPAPSCLKMFHHIWAALLYLCGILLNSIYQCPEHSQLTTEGVDGKEVCTEQMGSCWVGGGGLWWTRVRGPAWPESHTGRKKGCECCDDESNK